MRMDALCDWTKRASPRPTNVKGDGYVPQRVEVGWLRQASEAPEHR